MRLDTIAADAAVSSPVKLRVIKGRIESTNPQLRGWAGLSRESHDPASGILDLSLMIGADRIGTVFRDIVRKDVNANLGYEGAPKGFVVDVSACFGFARAVGAGPVSILVQAADAKDVRLEAADPAADDEPLSWATRREGLHLRDAWMATARRISLRFEQTGATREYQISAFQSTLGPDRRIVRLPSSGAVGQKIGIVSFDTLNPFMPILLVLSGLDGVIIGANWIPFPSLARRGLHATELRALGQSTNGMLDLAVLSKQMSDQFGDRLAVPAASRLRCDRVVMRMRDGLGTEPIFNRDLVDMMTRWLGITIEIQRDEDAPVGGAAELLALRLPSPEHPPASRSVTLTLMKDAVPTISAMVGPYVASKDIGGHFTSYIASDPKTPETTWLVTLPISPHAAGTEDASVARLTVSRAESLEIFSMSPVAIVVSRNLPRIKPSLIFPEGPKKPRSPDIEPQPFTVLIASSDTKSPPTALLHSLLAQDFAISEILYALRKGQPAEPVTEILSLLFPGRARTIEMPLPLTVPQEFRALALQAENECLILLDAKTVLHDPSTLLQLKEDLFRERAGTSSCSLIRPGHVAEFVSGGYFLRGVNLRLNPALEFELMNVEQLLEGPYRVPAAPLGVVATSKTVMRSTRAFVGTTNNDEFDEIRFGLDILRSGRNHSIITTVSATTTRVFRQAVYSVPYAAEPKLFDRVQQQSVNFSRI